MEFAQSINGSDSAAIQAGMNCEILDILYIRSNGEIPCNCSFGEQVNLDWAKSDADWDIDKVFYNSRFQHIRDSFKNGEMPWKECADCAFLNKDEPVRDLISQKRITKVHLEPSLACKLRCPGCSRVDQAKTRLSPFFMEPAIWERVLSSLSEKGYSVDLFFYCGQGEPINNPKFNELVQITNKYFPDTEQAVNTNGNHDYPSTIGRLGKDRPDLFIVSIDGLYQESYEKYRVRGNVEQALKFMEDAKSPDNPHPPVVEWKYILFKYNDSDEEIIGAQRKALELGVDRIQFVLTHTPEKSRKYTVENYHELPIISDIAYAQTTVQGLSHSIRGEQKSAQPQEIAPNANANIRVANFFFMKSGLMSIYGFVSNNATTAADRVSLELNGDPIGEIEIDPESKKTDNFFSLATQRPFDGERHKNLRVRLHANGQELAYSDFQYEFTDEANSRNVNPY